MKNTSSANRRKRKRAIHVADFVQVLKENLDRNGPRITIVLDDAHRLAEQKDDRFLPTLLKIGELTKRNIHVVTISCESIQTFQTTVDLVKPQTIFFGAYTKKELIEVLLKEAPRDIAGTVSGISGSYCGVFMTRVARRRASNGVGAVVEEVQREVIRGDTERNARERVTGTAKVIR